MRGEDLACRYGGEEFALILPGAGLDDALRHAEELRAATARLSVDAHGHPSGLVTLSLGVAGFPAQGRTPKMVIAAADAALYAAKRSGRDRVVSVEAAVCKAADADNLSKAG